MKQLLLFILLISISISGMTQVKTEKINYKGWDNAIQLSNNEIKVVVVPQIGRIIYFSYLNDENLLYENQELEGQVFSADNPYKKEGEISHAGYGGDRVWPTVQDSFVVYNGDRGLSDPWIDGSPWTFELVKDGVKISSPVSEYLGINVTRTITLEKMGAAVSIQQKMTKKKTSCKKEFEPIPVTIWNLSKVKNPLIGILPLSKNSLFKNGIDFQKWPDNINSAEKNYSQHGNIGQLVPVPDLFQKMGADSKGWVAGVYDDMVFGQFFTHDPNETYPDGGTSATIFTCTAFSELECLSPLKKLEVGESIEFDIKWKLNRIKAGSLDRKREEAVKWLDAQL